MTLLVFAGKAGIGKTTLACAAALRRARAYSGRRILLLAADPAHSLAALADCLNMPVAPERNN